MRRDVQRSGARLLLCGGLTFAAACGGDESDTTLQVTWSFESGDCGSNGVETVRVSWGPQAGPTADVEFPCTDGGGTLGDIGDIGGGGGIAIAAEGLDADGVARAESYGQTATFGGGGTGGIPLDITLHPSTADVVVSWSLAGGGGCPSGVILPYFVTLYRAPSDPGGELTDEVTSTQESCSAGEATLSRVAPGDYVVEVDSRAVVPALRATAPVTVEAGQDASVTVEF